MSVALKRKVWRFVIASWMISTVLLLVLVFVVHDAAFGFFGRSAATRQSANIYYMRNSLGVRYVPPQAATLEVDTPWKFELRFFDAADYANQSGAPDLPWYGLAVNSIATNDGRTSYQAVIHLFIPLILWCCPIAICTYFLCRARMLQHTSACPTCRYDLRGSVDSERCPECGTAIDDAMRQRIRAMGETPTVL
jgi:hypothetical protein